MFFSFVFASQLFYLGMKIKKTILGELSWTASHSDNSQYLIFDLDQTMRVTAIAIQGKPAHDEFVLEYAISYGSNGYDYADYKTSSGNVKVRS